MDTKFWGPSGWRLLHTLTFTYEPTKHRLAMREFFDTLPFILPCKFCRASLSEYYCSDTIDLKSSATLSRWLYRIHNKVNDKLRSQGQSIPKDPTYESIEKHYKGSLPRQDDDACQSFPGWDFLFSVAYSHPLSVKGSPMPPQDFDCPSWTADQRANHDNTLAPASRFTYWRRFWQLLPQVMPAAWAGAWKPRTRPNSLQGRRDSTNWLWHIRCGFSHGADPYRQVCRRLASYESGCSKSARARTCRKTRKKA